MIANATADATGVHIYHQDDESQPESTTEPGEVLILVPQSEPSISFTVPICP